MRILGLDPGSHFTGYGVLDWAGSRATHVDNGVIALADGPLPSRLSELSTRLNEVIDAHAPDVAAVESVFAHRNFQSAFILAQARGALLAVLGLRRVPVFEYAPADIKKTLTGNGRAEKPQMQRIVRMLLKLPEDAAADASDALAAAFCHVRMARTHAVLGGR